MTTKIPTAHSVQAHVKRAAKDQGLGFKATRSHGSVTVETLYSWEAERLDLAVLQGSVATWLRSVLTEDELLQVDVCVLVDNSDAGTDYFSMPSRRVAANWQHFLQLWSVDTDWARSLLGQTPGVTYSYRYNRGDYGFCAETVEDLAPSALAARAVALCQVGYWEEVRRESSGPARTKSWAELKEDRDLAFARIMKLNADALALFEAMMNGWELTLGELVDAVEILVPQEADFDPTPAPVAAGEMPQALQDYLGRLLHEPKRVLVLDIWSALQSGGELPINIAPWAADVQAKVLRYAKV